jgi:hypothetical protein
LHRINKTAITPSINVDEYVRDGIFFWIKRFSWFCLSHKKARFLFIKDPKDHRFGQKTTRLWVIIITGKSGKATIVVYAWLMPQLVMKLLVAVLAKKIADYARDRKYPDLGFALQ